MTRPHLSSALLEHRNVVVTGASDGIGRETVRALAQTGASVVMVGRNEAKTAAAARAIMAETGRRDITWEIADLSRQDAVHDVAARLRGRLPCIDVLINNAGAMFLDRELTAEGLERTFALNHLAYFTLTLLLLDRLAQVEPTRRPARVICVASRAHRDAHLALDDLQSERGYSGWRAYDNSKLANILFTRALARRLDPQKVVVHAMHPGVVSTRFAVNNGRRGRVMRRVMDVVSVDAATGADTVAWLATDEAPCATTGDYWVKRARIEPSSAALDPLSADTLWERSATLARLDADAIVATSGMARLPVPA